MSELDTSPMKALADALAALGGPANGHLHYSEAEMLARIHTLLGSPASHLTTSRNALLAGIRNLLSDAADLSHKTSSDTEILADIAGVSALTTSPGALWDLAATEMGGGAGQAADYYISATGDNGNAGTSIATAFATFAPVNTIMQAAGNDTAVSVRVLAGTYVDKGPGDIGTNINAGCYLTVYVDEGTVFTGPTGVDRSFINVTGLAWTIEIIGLDGGFTIQTYDTGTGNGLGMDSSGGATLIARNITIQGCVDGFSCHGTNSNAQVYDLTILDNSKSAVAHVNTGGSISHYRCSFRSRVGGAVLGMVAETTTNSTNHYYEDCDFIPVGTIQSERNVDLYNARAVNCRFGTASACVNFVGSAGVMRLEDSYLNAFWDQNRPVNILRCYGKVTIRQRNTAVQSIIDHGVFVDGATGQTDAFLFRNFDPGSAGDIQIRNTVLRGYVTALGSGYGATDAGYWAASGSVLDHCCTFGNTTNVDADIVTADAASIIAQVTSDPQMPGAFNTTNQADYVVGAAGPCVGAGIAGANIGFTAADIA